jgi:hypothetical protein
MTRIEEVTRGVCDAIADGVSKRSRLRDEILAYRGMSGVKYKHFINNLLSRSFVKRYLEIGVFEGSTAIAAAYGNEDVECFHIDNFSLFGVTPDKFLSNYKAAIGKVPFLINNDCFAIDPLTYGIRDIDIYFYDGDHAEINHYRALHHYYKAMADTFVLIVDDWGWKDVQSGTYRAIKDLGLRIDGRFEFGIDFVKPEENPTGIGNEDGWWCGCGIFILSK